MKINTLLPTLCLALGLLTTPRTIQAQKDGDAQTVMFDAQNRPTIQFAAKNEKLDCCGVFVSYTVMDNEEEALAIRVAHAHRQGWGAITFPEKGWLYITASRIVFLIEEGDVSHASNNNVSASSCLLTFTKKTDRLITTATLVREPS